jgi:hypothetical protein
VNPKAAIQELIREATDAHDVHVWPHDDIGSHPVSSRGCNLCAAIAGAEAVLAESSTSKMSEVLEMNLCEQRQVILQPNRLYRFVVSPGCAECARLEKEGKRP